MSYASVIAGLQMSSHLWTYALLVPIYMHICIQYMPIYANCTLCRSCQSSQLKWVTQKFCSLWPKGSERYENVSSFHQLLQQIVLQVPFKYFLCEHLKIRLPEVAMDVEKKKTYNGAI